MGRRILRYFSTPHAQIDVVMCHVTSLAGRRELLLSKSGYFSAVQAGFPESRF